ncbi:hypothetical protein H9P43_009380 [Blastocladiella emersonii ATCC 22665]|nr:hypothetical protein H9P43_009380 [Blastocladiella emersonii ATCC 22665]
MDPPTVEELNAAMNIGPEITDLATRLIANAGHVAASTLCDFFALCLRTLIPGLIPVIRFRSNPLLSAAAASLLMKLFVTRIRETLATAARDSLWPYFLSKNTALYSVPPELITLAMERFCLPSIFIKFYTCHMRREELGRKLFHGRGIPQAVVETDLIWEIVYDVCLSELQLLAVKVKGSPSLWSSKTNNAYTRCAKIFVF